MLLGHTAPGGAIRTEVYAKGAAWSCVVRNLSGLCVVALLMGSLASWSVESSREDK